MSGDPFSIEIDKNASVDELRSMIMHNNSHAFADVDARQIMLWKLHEAKPADSVETFLEHLAHVDLSTIAKKLNPLSELSTEFSEDHPKQRHLHIIVTTSGRKRGPDYFFPDEGKGKQRCPDTAFDGELEQSFGEVHRWTDFWKLLWAKGSDHFRTEFIEEREIQCDGDTVTFRVMRIHDAFNLDLGGLLIRDEWDITYAHAKGAFESGMNNFIVIGQPGIGKTLSLYYLLSIRVASGLPTLFQDNPDEVWYFDANGVHCLSSNMHWTNIQGITRARVHWALVDSNRLVNDPAPLIFHKGSPPFFIVEAASPRDNRWAWSKYHGKTHCFYTQPFSLSEIFQANSLQLQPADHAVLRNFFTEYGPSARSCYNATTSDRALAAYVNDVNIAVRKMTWDDIDRIVTATTSESQFDKDIPFRVIVIVPADEERTKCHATVMTPTILRLLWKAHGLHIRRKGKELFHVYSMNPQSAADGGWVFEAIVKEKLEVGIDVPLDNMKFTANNRIDAVNDKYVSSLISNRRWQSGPMTYMPFTQNNRTLIPQPSHYYVPIDVNSPTYDSFAFEYISCSLYEDPIINPDKDLLKKADLDENSNVALFTVFQSTKGSKHGVNEKGLNFVCAVAKRMSLPAIAIRFMGIGPTGRSQTFTISVFWRGKISLYSLPISLYDMPESS